MTAINSIGDIVLSVIPKTRPLGEQELIERYKKACDKHKVLALHGQLKTALKRLFQENQIAFVTVDGTKRVKKLKA